MQEVREKQQRINEQREVADLWKRMRKLADIKLAVTWLLKKLYSFVSFSFFVWGAFFANVCVPRRAGNRHPKLVKKQMFGPYRLSYVFTHFHM